MATRLKAALPLTLSIGLLAFLASEVALNFTFHWVTVENGVFGEYGPAAERAPDPARAVRRVGSVLPARRGQRRVRRNP